MVDFKDYYEEVEFDIYKVQARPTASSWNSVDKSFDFIKKRSRNALKASVWVVLIHLYGARG